MSDFSVRERSASFLFSLGAVVLLMGLLARRLFLWEKNGFIILASVPETLIVAGILVGGALLLVRGRLKNLRLSCAAFVLGLFLVFISDWLTKSYNFFQGPLIRGEILLLALCAAALPQLGRIVALQFLPFFTVVLTVASFFLVSKGRLLFSDDHAVFLYRLQLLKDNFPAIPFYNPMWNAGIDSRDFFATGSLNLFFLNLPLIYLFEMSSIYNTIVALSVLVLPALSTYLACKLAQAPKPVPAIAAALTLCSSLSWYRWAFKYGTMGFIVSCALVPLACILTAKILSSSEELTKKEALLFVAVITLMLLWSPTGLVFLPAMVWGLVSLRRLWKKKYILLVVVALLIINLPWIILFTSVSQIFDFFHGKHPSIYSTEMGSLPNTTEGRIESLSVQEREIGPLVAPGDVPAGIDLKKSFTVLRHHAVSANPLILLLALPGLFLMSGTKRVLMIVTGVWLGLLGTLLVPIKPHMEFDRMLVILLFLSAIPTAYAVRQVIIDAQTSGSKLAYLAMGITLGFLFVGPFAAANVLHNRSYVHYDFARPVVKELTDAIVTHGGGGRTMFAGFILHELSQGHLAPLIHLTKHPLMASTFVHNVWQPKDIIPGGFLRRSDRDNAVREFLDMHNVSSLVTHETVWFNYFSERPADYEKVWHYDRFTIFRRLNFVSDYFLQGAGELVAQNTSSLNLRVFSESSVIKFGYFPFLTSSACTLSAHKIDDDISFVRLESCPVGEEIVIKGKSGFSRLWG